MAAACIPKSPLNAGGEHKPQQLAASIDNAARTALEVYGAQVTSASVPHAAGGPGGVMLSICTIMLEPSRIHHEA